ncbi:hypothetical protein F5I97DRAFT_190995 [Phlebopus sp. FC_14]|nr:hypothetical protein F5I97DRAFT_190995 [Phlebopus sp. FC_14]
MNAAKWRYTIHYRCSCQNGTRKKVCARNAHRPCSSTLRCSPTNWRWRHHLRKSTRLELTASRDALYALTPTLNIPTHFHLNNFMSCFSFFLCAATRPNFSPCCSWLRRYPRGRLSVRPCYEQLWTSKHPFIASSIQEEGMGRWLRTCLSVPGCSVRSRELYPGCSSLKFETWACIAQRIGVIFEDAVSSSD